LRPYLSRRIGSAFYVGFANWVGQDVLSDAAGAARVRTFRDLHAYAGKLLVGLENRGERFPLPS
jgi:hypothetical protein